MKFIFTIPTTITKSSSSSKSLTRKTTTTKLPPTINIFYIWLAIFAFCHNYEHNLVQCSGFGRCPKYPPMSTFNITKFYGTWFELERSFYLPEIAASCTELTFVEDNNNYWTGYDANKIKVAVKSKNQWTGNPSTNTGFAIPIGERSAIMNFQFKSELPSVIARIMPGSGKYQVLYTDYDNFSILWSCTFLGAVYQDQIWLLGRERVDFDVDTRAKIHDTLNRLGLDPDRLIVSKNKNCSNNF